MTVPSDKDLLALHAAHKLPAALACQFGLIDGAEVAGLKAACIRLHNGRDWNLFDLIGEDGVTGLVGIDFFMASHFFCSLLPELDAEVMQVVEAVELLVAQGGDDLGSNTPNVALRKWLAKDAKRSHQVIEAARAGIEGAVRNLTFAFEALSSIDTARSFLAASDNRIVLSAVTALGRLPDVNRSSRKATIAAFAEIAGPADAFLKANLLFSTAFLLSQRGAAVGKAELALLRQLIDDPDVQIAHAAARLIWTSSGARRPKVYPMLMKRAALGDQSNASWINDLDLSLKALFEGGHSEYVVDFVREEFSDPNGFALEKLKGFLQALVAGPNDILARAIVSWLLDGSAQLCHALSNAFGPEQDDARIIHAENALRGLSDVQQIFVCRKAIGWFLLKARTAASVIVSLLRSCSSKVAEQAQGLLLSPLLANYGGLREYLLSIDPSDNAHAHVQAALDQNESYLEGCRKVPEIRELHPSEAHRGIQRVRMTDQGREIAKMAREQSVLWRLVKNSVILYGSRSIGFVPERDGTLRRYEMDLHPHGFSFELPRMEITDPVTLDYLMRVFRTERLAK